jgi:hypothetical protein
VISDSLLYKEISGNEWKRNNQAINYNYFQNCKALGKLMGQFNQDYDLITFLPGDDYFLRGFFIDISVDIILMGTNVNDYVEVYIGQTLIKRIYHTSLVEPFTNPINCPPFDIGNSKVSLAENFLEVEFSIENIDYFNRDSNNLYLRFKPVFTAPTDSKFLGIGKAAIYYIQSSAEPSFPCRTSWGPEIYQCLTCDVDYYLNEGRCFCSNPATYRYFDTKCRTCPNGCQSCKQDSLLYCYQCMDDFSNQPPQNGFISNVCLASNAAGKY